MPSRSFYHQTPDGCLQQGTLEEMNEPRSKSPAKNPITNNLYVMIETSRCTMDDTEDWFTEEYKMEAVHDRKSRRERLVNSQQWQDTLATHAFDNISNQLNFEDAPFELDDIVASMSALVDSDYRHSTSTIDTGDRESTQRSYHGYSWLSISEERALRDIAMPSHVPPHTPAIEDGGLPYSSKPETGVSCKKHKGSTASEGGDTIYQHQTRKQGHNAIEKRYRNNLNDKIAALQQCLPSMRTPLKVEESGEANGGELPSLDAAQKSGKAAVLTGAVEYITQLERNMTQLNTETAALKTRLAAFEKLVISGSIVLGNSSSRVSRVRKTGGG